MICFQDRTFCGDAACAGKCGFPVFTPELEVKAAKWAEGFGITDPDEVPVCFIIHEPEAA